MVHTTTHQSPDRHEEYQLSWTLVASISTMFRDPPLFSFFKDYEQQKNSSTIRQALHGVSCVVCVQVINVCMSAVRRVRRCSSFPFCWPTVPELLQREDWRLASKLPLPLQLQEFLQSTHQTLTTFLAASLLDRVSTKIIQTWTKIFLYKYNCLTCLDCCTKKHLFRTTPHSNKVVGISSNGLEFRTTSMLTLKIRVLGVSSSTLSDGHGCTTVGSSWANPMSSWTCRNKLLLSTPHTEHNIRILRKIEWRLTVWLIARRMPSKPAVPSQSQSQSVITTSTSSMFSHHQFNSRNRFTYTSKILLEFPNDCCQKSDFLRKSN